MASKAELVSGLKEQGERAQNMASQMSDEDWQMGVHEAGWTVKQAYCHLASTAGALPFLVQLSKQAPGEGGGDAPFDINEFNKHQVGLRAEKEPMEIVGEIRDSFATGARTLEDMDDSALENKMTSFVTGQPDSLANMIEMVMVNHFKGHLDEIGQITGHN